MKATINDAGKKTRLNRKKARKLWPLRAATRAGQNAMAIHTTRARNHHRNEPIVSNMPLPFVCTCDLTESRRLPITAPEPHQADSQVDVRWRFAGVSANPDHRNASHHPRRAPCSESPG